MPDGDHVHLRPAAPAGSAFIPAPVTPYLGAARVPHVNGIEATLFEEEASA